MASGLVLPQGKHVEKLQFIQADLCQSQLPRYLQLLEDCDAELSTIFLQGTFGIGRRFTVVYWHTEILECEILC